MSEREWSTAEAPGYDANGTPVELTDPQPIMSTEQKHGLKWALAEVEIERLRQHRKWGEQSHPNGTAFDAWALQRDIAKRETDEAAAKGEVTYVHILREEVLEAFCETDPAKLRAELVQVAAVAVQWVEKLDRDAHKSVNQPNNEVSNASRP